jgi:hypothetical protein
MLRKRSLGLVFVILFTAIVGRAQMQGYPQMPGEKLDATVALDRALKTSSLPFKGKPFHAVMEIGTSGVPYSGRVEVWWINSTKYRLAISSPKFSQIKIVDGDRVKERNKRRRLLSALAGGFCFSHNRSASHGGTFPRQWRGGDGWRSNDKKLPAPR